MSILDDICLNCGRRTILANHACGGATSEVWKQVPNFPNYEVSSLGNVRNIITGKTLKPFLHQKGYLYVALYGSVRQNFRLHRIVMNTFKPIQAKLDIDHINGNRADNRLENLRWCTKAENNAYMVERGTQVRGTTNAASKLNDRSVEAIRYLHSKAGVSQYKLAHAFKVDGGTIAAIIERRTWTHV